MKKKKKRVSVLWTDKEDALICKLRREGAEPHEVAAELPHRTPDAVRRRSAILLKAGRITSLRVAWSAEEDATIRELRAQGVGFAAIAEQLQNRTEDAVEARARKLRALEGRHVGQKPSRPWTDREESLIIELREQNAKVREIRAKLPHRTPRAVQSRIEGLIALEEVERSAAAPRSYRPWSAEEDLLLATMREAKKTTAEIAKALGRYPESVTGHIAYLLSKGELGSVRAGRKKGKGATP